MSSDTWNNWFANMPKENKLDILTGQMLAVKKQYVYDKVFTTTNYEVCAGTGAASVGIDVYNVCDVFAINDPSGATQHAIKKLLCPGQRGSKGILKDYKEALDSIQRRIDDLTIQGM